MNIIIVCTPDLIQYRRFSEMTEESNECVI